MLCIRPCFSFPWFFSFPRFLSFPLSFFLSFFPFLDSFPQYFFHLVCWFSTLIYVHFVSASRSTWKLTMNLFQAEWSVTKRIGLRSFWTHEWMAPLKQISKAPPKTFSFVRLPKGKCENSVKGSNAVLYSRKPWYWVIKSHSIPRAREPVRERAGCAEQVEGMEKWRVNGPALKF